MKLKDNVAISTGVAAAQTPWKAIADAFGIKGPRVAICNINEKAVKEGSGEIAARGTPCMGLRCDISSVDGVQELFTKIVQKFGAVDILVNISVLMTTK